jgi:hypothetical protein
MLPRPSPPNIDWSGCHCVAAQDAYHRYGPHITAAGVRLVGKAAAAAGVEIIGKDNTAKAIGQLGSTNAAAATEELGVMGVLKVGLGV